MTKITGSGSGSRSVSVRGMDPRIRIHTKMSWIRNLPLRKNVFLYRGGLIAQLYGSAQAGHVDAIQIEIPGEIR